MESVGRQWGFEDSSAVLHFQELCRLPSSHRRDEVEAYGRSRCQSWDERLQWALLAPRLRSIFDVGGQGKPNINHILSRAHIVIGTGNSWTESGKRYHCNTNIRPGISN